MNEVIKNIMSRRSIRNYEGEQVSDELMELIIESGKYAPSGGNSQKRLFTAIQDKELLNRLNLSVIEAFRNLEVDEKTYISKKSGKKKASENGSYNFYYNAPVLIIVSNDREQSNCMADSAVALENILLAAHSLGLGACFINQLTWFCDDNNVRSVLNDLEIPENYIVCGSAAIGHIGGNIQKAPIKNGAVKYWK